jgi:hypothetical protein
LRRNALKKSQVTAELNTVLILNTLFSQKLSFTNPTSVVGLQLLILITESHAQMLK